MQPSLDHFLAQGIGISPNRRAGRDTMLERTIRGGLLSNTFVKNQQPFVRRLFKIHDQPLK
jgi:hypothetical protein